MKTKEEKLLQAAKLAPSEEWREKITEVHPMRQVFIMSIVQIVVLAFMGISMFAIGLVFK